MISENAVRAIRDMTMKDFEHTLSSIKSGSYSPAIIDCMRENARAYQSKIHLLDLILEELKSEEWYDAEIP